MDLLYVYTSIIKIFQKSQPFNIKLCLQGNFLISQINVEKIVPHLLSKKKSSIVCTLDNCSKKKFIHCLNLLKLQNLLSPILFLFYDQLFWFFIIVCKSWWMHLTESRQTFEMTHRIANFRETKLLYDEKSGQQEIF